uniref:Hint domain-containing protein n=1 Tax=Rhizobium sp. F40D2 TaxID=3453141 RepID=UPI003F24223C
MRPLPGRVPEPALFLTLADARSSTAQQLGSPVAKAGTLSKSKVILLAVRSACFCAGVSIRTCHRHYGARPVGELWKHRGQTVATATSSRRNIELFCQSLQSLPAGVVGLRACVLPDVVPIRVSRCALDGRTPHSDLYLSPGHALFLNGVLIQVKELVNGTTIAPVAPANDISIEYYAVMLDITRYSATRSARAFGFATSRHLHHLPGRDPAAARTG